MARKALLDEYIMVRVTKKTRETLGEIARERGLVGGRGVKEDEPNLGGTVRALLTKADPRLKDD